MTSTFTFTMTLHSVPSDGRFPERLHPSCHSEHLSFRALDLGGARSRKRRQRRSDRATRMARTLVPGPWVSVGPAVRPDSRQSDQEPVCVGRTRTSGRSSSPCPGAGAGERRVLFCQSCRLFRLLIAVRYIRAICELRLNISGGGNVVHANLNAAIYSQAPGDEKAGRFLKTNQRSLSL